MFQFKSWYGSHASERNYKFISDIRDRVKPCDEETDCSQSQNILSYRILLGSLNQNSNLKDVLMRHIYLFDPVDVDHKLLYKFISHMLEPNTNTELMNALADINGQFNCNTLSSHLSKWKKCYKLEIMGDRRDIQVVFVHAVAMFGRSHLVKPLYRCRVNFDAKTIEGFTPLMLASRFGHTELVRKLCNVVESLDTVCDVGYTALHFAVCYNHKDIVEILLENGADIRVPSGGYIGCPIVFGVLLEHNDICVTLMRIFGDRFKKWKQTDMENFGLPRRLLSFFETYYGKVLQAAVSVGNKHIIDMFQYEYEALIKDFEDTSYPDILNNIADENGFNLVMMASRIGNTTILESLINLGVGADSKNHEGNTALHLAASNGKTDAVKLLLDIKRIKIINTKGETPLLAALKMCKPMSSEGQWDTVQVIIDFAIQSKQESIFGMQDTAGVAAIHCVVAAGNVQLLKTLLKYDPSCFNLRNKSGDTALHIAALRGFDAIVEIMPDDVNFCMANRNGSTPLHQAARCDEMCTPNKTVSFRVASESFNTKRGTDGSTPLHQAARWDEMCTPNKTVSFRAASESLNTKMGTDGSTSLQQAARCDGMCTPNTTVSFRAASESLYTKRGTDGIQKKAKVMQLLLRKAEKNESNLVDIGSIQNLLLMKDENGCNPLHLAVKNEKDDIAKSVIDFVVPTAANTDVSIVHTLLEKQDNDGRTPLFLAALMGHMSLTERLMELHANSLLITDNLGKNPLHIAASLGHLSVVRVILKFIENNQLEELIPAVAEAESRVVISQQSFCEICDNTGSNALHLAVSSRNFKIDAVKLLSQLYPSLCQKQNKNGKTPLYFAAHYGNKEATSELLRRSDLSHITNSEGWSPLHEAALKGHSEIVSIICDSLISSPDAPMEDRLATKLAGMIDRNGKTPVHLAFECGHIKTIEVFLRDPKILKLRMEKCHTTPLHLAVKRGQTEVVRLVVAFVNAKKNEDQFKKLTDVFDMRDSDRYTLMHSAAELKTSEIFRILLDSTNNITECDRKEWTPLHVAADRGNVEVVSEFIYYSYSNTDDLVRMPRIMKSQIALLLSQEGETALYLAASKDHTQVVDKLLYSSRMSMTDRKKNPIHIAAKKGYWETVQIIMRFMESLGECRKLDNDCFVTELALLRDADGNTPLHLAAIEGHVDVVRILLKYKKAQIAKNTTEQWTALHVAARHGHATVVKEIVNAIGKEKVDEVDRLGRTALHWAADHGGIECIKELTCCNPNIQCQSQTTALMICAARGDTVCVKWLIDHGANVSIRNRLCETALHIAVRRGNVDCIKELKSGAYNIMNESNDEQTTLHCAAQSHIPGLLKAFLKTFPEIDDNQEYLNRLDKDGYTALMICAHRGDIEGVNLLIRYKAVLNAGMEVGVLHRLIEQYVETPQNEKLLEIIRLLNNNAVNHEPKLCNIKKRSINLKVELTPIELSAALGSFVILKMLLAKTTVQSKKTVRFYLKDIVPKALMHQNSTSDEQNLITDNEYEMSVYNTESNERLT